MVFRVVGLYNLQMSTNTDEEEPETETPEPEPSEVRKEFEEECCVCVAEISVWHDFRDDGVAEVNNAGDCEPAGTHGHELQFVR